MQCRSTSPRSPNVQAYDGGGAAYPRSRKPDRPITIADLLTHTAGLTYGPFGETAVDSMYQRAIARLDSAGRPILPASWTLAQLADSVARMPLLFSPGTAWNYSFAIDILGRRGGCLRQALRPLPCGRDSRTGGHAEHGVSRDAGHAWTNHNDVHDWHERSSRAGPATARARVSRRREIIPRWIGPTLNGARLSALHANVAQWRSLDGHRSLLALSTRFDDCRQLRKRHAPASLVVCDGDTWG